MRREYTYAGYRAIVDHARRLMPRISLTTDVIVGFPGETEEDFRATVRALEEVRFDSGFLFAYSPRRGTEAFAWRDDVPAEVKKERLHEVIDLQRRLTDESSRRFVGGTVEVLFEARAPKGAGEILGKSREHRSVLSPGDERRIGTIAEVRVTRSHGVTLHAEGDRIS
jgi:tRNA-2-methylthio-N6-dimethylallyladenosine synthase